MCTIGEMMKRIQKIDVLNVAEESMLETKKDYLEWQKEQLNVGKKKTGGAIRPAYSPATIRIKKKKGQPTDRVTLKDTGFFYDSIFLTIIRGSGTIRTISSDVKSRWLIERYGENILGLGGIFKTGYVSDLRPVWQTKIENITKLSFS